MIINENSKENLKIHFLLVDTPNSLKKYEYDDIRAESPSPRQAGLPVEERLYDPPQYEHEVG